MSVVSVTSTINVTGLYDGGGRTFVNNIPFDSVNPDDGTPYSDKPVFDVATTGRLINARVNDNFAGWVSGAVQVRGAGILEDCWLDQCQRYGFIVVGGNKAQMRRLHVLWAQHGISGSSGVVGDWRNPSYDTIIEDCDVSGFIIHGIKLKQMVRTIVRNNRVDSFPSHPGYINVPINNPVYGKTYSKVGLVFANGDTATKDSTVENNEFFQSAPTPAGLANNYGVLTTPDQTAVPSVFSSGNVAQNNVFRDVYYGFVTRGKNFTMMNNTMQNVHTPFYNQSGDPTNVYIEGIPKYLTLQSSLPQLPWLMNGVARLNGVYPFPTGATVTLQVPKTVSV